MDSKNILLVGSSGFLGSHLTRALEIETPDRSIFNLESLNVNLISNLIKKSNYSHIIICAAITDVEKCFQDQKLSYSINVTGTQAILDIAKTQNLIPIFFSTDYVFSGESTPYLESSPRNPLTVYGSQKLKIEQYIETHFSQYLIFRTSKLMSKTNHPKNILLPIIKSLVANESIKCFKDQWLNPVFVEDIAEVIKLSIANNLSGVFHLGTRRIFTRFELAQKLAELLHFDSDLIQPISMNDISFSEARPANNTLNCNKIESVLEFLFCEVEDVINDLKMLAY